MGQQLDAAGRTGLPLVHARSELGELPQYRRGEIVFDVSRGPDGDSLVRTLPRPPGAETGASPRHLASGRRSALQGRGASVADPRPLSFTDSVKAMPRISTKNQVTIPVAVLEEARLHAGDQVVVEALAEGEVRIRRGELGFEKAFGALTGTYPARYLERLDREDAER